MAARRERLGSSTWPLWCSGCLISCLFPFLSHLAVTDSCVCRSCADHPCLPSIPPEETFATGSPILGTFDSMPFLYAVKSLLLLERIGCLRRVYG